jgi:16S rRNA processing protein RimM
MRICVGQILGVHGVKGLVKLASFTEDPEAIARYRPLTDERGTRSFTIALRGVQKSHFLAHIDGIDDRDVAAALTGTRLYVERDLLPAPDVDEVYHADLIGLRAELPDGTPFGAVAAIHNFGAGDLIEIVQPGGKRPVLPFNRAGVPEIDIAGGRIVVDPPAGLLDDGGESGDLADEDAA